MVNVGDILRPLGRTLAEQFKAKRQPDYVDAVEFFALVESVDAKSCVRRNEAGNAEIVFRDGSTYIIGLDG